jgi:hypothetical protein
MCQGGLEKGMIFDILAEGVPATGVVTCNGDCAAHEADSCDRVVKSCDVD